MGCTKMTDSMKDNTMAVSHCADFSCPHSMLYRITKNPHAATDQKYVVTKNYILEYSYYISGVQSILPMLGTDKHIKVMVLDIRKYKPYNSGRECRFIFNIYLFTYRHVYMYV